MSNHDYFSFISAFFVCFIISLPFLYLVLLVIISHITGTGDGASQASPNHTNQELKSNDGEDSSTGIIFSFLRDFCARRPISPYGSNLITADQIGPVGRAEHY
jgi:hypothetical protein